MLPKYVVLFLILFFSCNGEKSLENEFQQLQSNLTRIADFKEHCERIIKDPEQSVEKASAIYYMGRFNELFSHYDEAIQFYRYLLILYPDHELCAESLYRTGYIYTNNLDKKTEAKIAYNQLITFYPDSPFAEKALIRHAQLSCEQKSWHEAVDFFDIYSKKYPEGNVREEVAFRIADIMQSGIKDTVKAESLYTDFIKTYPRSSWRAFAEEKIDKIQESEVRNQKSRSSEVQNSEGLE